jgi:hypothetical protein
MKSTKVQYKSRNTRPTGQDHPRPQGLSDTRVLPRVWDIRTKFQKFSGGGHAPKPP